jgi:hypothetical protein
MLFLREENQTGRTDRNDNVTYRGLDERTSCYLSEVRMGDTQ